MRCIANRAKSYKIITIKMHCNPDADTYEFVSKLQLYKHID